MSPFQPYFLLSPWGISVLENLTHPLPGGFLGPGGQCRYSHLQERKIRNSGSRLLLSLWSLGVTSGPAAHQKEGGHTSWQVWGQTWRLRWREKLASWGGETHTHNRTRGTRSSVVVWGNMGDRVLGHLLYDCDPCDPFWSSKGIVSAYILPKEVTFGMPALFLNGPRQAAPLMKGNCLMSVLLPEPEFLIFPVVTHL